MASLSLGLDGPDVATSEPFTIQCEENRYRQIFQRHLATNDGLDFAVMKASELILGKRSLGQKFLPLADPSLATSFVATDLSADGSSALSGGSVSAL